MNLTLVYPLTYKPTDINYDEALKTIYSAPIGSDMVFRYSYEILDEEILINHLSSGEKIPLTQEEKSVIESGLPPLKRDGEITFIQAGKYSFSQLPPANAEADLHLLIFGECEKTKGEIFIRLFKENTIEVIMQFFYPKED